MEKRRNIANSSALPAILKSQSISTHCVCCLSRTAKSRRLPSRSEVRVRLRVPLKLRGTDNHGKKFNEVATTENVSLSGFLCDCTVELLNDSVVDVYLTTHGEDCVGKAKVIHVNANGAPLRRYRCCFIEKPVLGCCSKASTMHSSGRTGRRKNDAQRVGDCALAGCEPWAI